MSRSRSGKTETCAPKTGRVEEIVTVWIPMAVTRPEQLRILEALDGPGVYVVASVAEVLIPARIPDLLANLESGRMNDWIRLDLHVMREV